MLVTIVLVALLLLVPGAWWRALWRTTRQPPREQPRLVALPDFELLEIAVPPSVEVAVTDGERTRDEPREMPDATWWDRAWEVRIRDDLPRDATPAAADSTPWIGLGALGLPTLLSAALAMPDSELAARIWELAWEDKVDLSVLADYFRSIGRSRVYEDLKSREAAMFGEFMFETVPITETGDD